MANLDFSNVASREALPEGMYSLLIEEAEDKVSSTGKDMLLIRFKEEESNTAIFENYVLTPAALWKLKQLCDVLSIDTSTNMDTSDLIPQLIGNYVKAKVVQDEYNGSTVNRVKNVFAA